MVSDMEKHTRFHIDLAQPDAKLLDKLAVYFSVKREAVVIRADVMRIALRALAKKERIV